MKKNINIFYVNVAIAALSFSLSGLTTSNAVNLVQIHHGETMITVGVGGLQSHLNHGDVLHQYVDCPAITCQLRVEIP